MDIGTPIGAAEENITVAATSRDIVQDVTFANEEDDDTGRDYLCPRTRPPVSPTVARPLTLDPLDIPRPLLTRTVRARLSLFYDV